jgi:putative endonuclease
LPDTRRATGQAGEAAAANYLHSLGYRVIAMNWRTRYGEIDIVAVDRETVVIVEVRTRTSPALGTAAESVGPRKQQQLVRMAEAFLQKQAPQSHARIDVVTFDGTRVEHLIGVVDGH